MKILEKLFFQKSPKNAILRPFLFVKPVFCE